FSDTAKLQQLNGIVHPAVAIAFEAFVSTHALAPLVFKEAAILFESGAAKHCDKTVLITAPLSVRIERVQQRDNSPEEAIIARIALQWPDEKKITLADFVLENQHWDITLVQLEKLYQSLLIQANATD
ncbi:MAG: dephospho-CoA kinase, partial [Flavobacteriaceae bacterium]